MLVIKSIISRLALTDSLLDIVRTALSLTLGSGFEGT